MALFPSGEPIVNVPVGISTAHVQTNAGQISNISGGFRGGAQGGRPPHPPFGGIFAKDL